jgi:serine/threonine protein kinase
MGADPDRISTHRAMDSPEQAGLDLEPSSVVGATYRIDRRVASGGSSLVYAARHIEMDRHVALKVLPLGGEIDASALERFSQEARLACQINHPNVVTIHQFGQDERGLLYIAMEWLKGTSLSDAIEERGPFSPLRVAQIGREIARGLQAVHGRDVLHRDLKPSNIMLAELADWEEIAKLLDFGVAKSLTPTEEQQLRITQEGKFVGTPRYAAPELIRGEELTVRTDIYSTGLLMWEALTGEPAVSSVVFQKCCARHLSDEPWRLPDDIDCPSPLADVIHRSLRKDPAERFESCRELAERLGEAVHEIASADAASRSAPVTGASTNRNSYGSQWTKLLFAVAVGATVLGLAGYQGWLSVTGNAESAPVGPDGASGESATLADIRDREPPSSPEELIERLESAGWRVTRRARKDGATQYRLEHRNHGETATIRVGAGADRPSATVSPTLAFSAYTVRVETSENRISPGTHRLLALLWTLRSGSDD